jgi:hypothetical protein
VVAFAETITLLHIISYKSVTGRINNLCPKKVMTNYFTIFEEKLLDLLVGLEDTTPMRLCKLVCFGR